MEETKIVAHKIDYSKVSSNAKVIELIKERENIEKKIRKIDETALINYELEVLKIDAKAIFNP